MDTKSSIQEDISDVSNFWLSIYDKKREKYTTRKLFCNLVKNKKLQKKKSSNGRDLKKKKI